MLTPLRASIFATSGVAVALLAGGCGDDEPKGGAATTPPTAATTAAAGDGEGTWLDYMAVSEGRTCGTAATVNGMKVRGTTRIHDVEKSGDTAKFVISTEGEIDGKKNPAMSMDIPYELQPDGSLSGGVNFPQNAAFEIDMDGAMTLPSIADLKAGKSATSTVTGTMKARDEATQKDLLSKLDPGSEGMVLKMELKVSPAKQRDEITTPGGTFTDVVGTDVEFTELSIANGASEEIDTIEEGIRKGLASAPTTTYYARGEGQVEAIAVGTPVKLTGCKG